MVELITVMAIIIIMIGLLGPAFNAMTSNAGRKGALNILMNTFEQARAAALESGANVYVVFWQRQFPENDCLIVLREPVEWKKEESDAYANDRYIQLTRYIQMPKGVLLYGGKGKNVFASNASPDEVPPDLTELKKHLPKMAGVAPAENEIGYVKFTPTGTIQHPDKDHSRLIISEGVRDANQTEALIANNKNSRGGFEIITFRRFTGRASVDVSTVE